MTEHEHEFLRALDERISQFSALHHSFEHILGEATMITARLEAAVVALENLPAPTPPDTTGATVAEQDAVAARLEAVATKQTTPAIPPTA